MRPRADAAFAPDDVRRFLSLLHEPGDVFEIRLPKYGRFKFTASGYFDNVDDATAAVGRWDGKASAFVTLNPINPALMARAANKIIERAEATTADEDIERRARLFIDLDAVRPSGISSTEDELAAAEALRGEIAAFLRSRGWPDPLVVMSGNGANLLYRIDLPNDDDARDLVAALLRSLAARFDSERVKVDTSVSNAARIMGLVGTLKMKGDSTDDRPHRRSYVTSAPEHFAVVSRAQLEAVAAGPSSASNAGSSSRTPRSGSLADALERAGIEYREQPPDANRVTWYHVRLCPFHEDGRPFECGVGQALPDGPYAGHCFHPEGEGKGWHEFKRAFGLDGAGGARDTHDPAMVSPTILVSSRHLHDIADDGWQALQEANHPPRLFLHGLDVGEVTRDAAGRSSITHLAIAGLRGRLDRCADWVKETKTGVAPARPPKDVVEDMLALEKPLPPLKGIVGTPTFASDGSLDCRPGYQPSTRLYYEPAGDTIPPIPAVPDATDLKRAKAYLYQEWLADFPFLDDASLTHSIAVPLTVMAREMIDGPTPLFAIDAPAPGSGKGLLASGIGVIVSGREAAVMTETRGEEERKRITALIRAGHPLMLLDNVKHQIESGTFAAMLTAPYWSDRILGVTQDVELPVRGVWMATGNNLQFDNDISRRTVWIRIDARVDRPWERSNFKKDNLIVWVRRHRHELVWACLILVQHWIATGRSEWRGKPLGSYESWSGVVGGILAAAGIPGFLDNRDALYSRADSETEEWRAFTRAWYAQHDVAAVKTGELLELAQNLVPSVFERARDNAGDRALRTRLGKALSQRRDRSFDGIFIRRAGDDAHDGGALWRLDRGTSNGSDDSSSAHVPQDNELSPDTSAEHAEHADDDLGVGAVSCDDDKGEHEVAATPKQHPHVPHVPQADSDPGAERADIVRNVTSKIADVPQCKRCREPLAGGSSNLCDGCRTALLAEMDPSP